MRRKRFLCFAIIFSTETLRADISKLYFFSTSCRLFPIMEERSLLPRTAVPKNVVIFIISAIIRRIINGFHFFLGLALIIHSSIMSYPRKSFTHQNHSICHGYQLELNPVMFFSSIIKRLLESVWPWWPTYLMETPIKKSPTPRIGTSCIINFRCAQRNPFGSKKSLIPSHHFLDFFKNEMQDVVSNSGDHASWSSEEGFMTEQGTRLAHSTKKNTKGGFWIYFTTIWE